MSERERYLVGYALEPKKVKTFILPSLLEHAERHGIDLVPVDPTAPLIGQGPFHCLLHKLYGRRWTHQLLEFSANFPRTPIVDPPDRIERLRTRVSMLDAVARIQIPGKRFQLGVPKQRVVEGDIRSQLGLEFPVIAKPLMADGGAASHDMLLVYHSEGLLGLKCKTPLVLQEFVNHGGVLFKVYVVGKHVECVRRSSLPDICISCAPDGGVLPFSRISNSKTPTTADEEEEQREQDSSNADGGVLVFAEEMAAALRHELGLRLFNFDVIRSSSDPNKLFIIDINYFPGYAKMPNYERVFTDFLLDVIPNDNPH